MGILQEQDCVEVRWPEQLYFLRYDEGGCILTVSFYECPVYVSQVSVVMLRDFIHSDFLLDWLTDKHNTFIWCGCEPVVTWHRVRIAMHTRPNQSGKRTHRTLDVCCLEYLKTSRMRQFSNMNTFSYEVPSCISCSSRKPLRTTGSVRKCSSHRWSLYVRKKI